MIFRKLLTATLVLSFGAGVFAQAPLNATARNLFSSFNSLLSDGPWHFNENQMYAKTEDLIVHGLDPNLSVDCNMPLVDFAMLHLVSAAGSDRPDLGPAEPALALIANGANLNARDMAGRTPLHLAVFRQDGKVTQALIKAGADVNAPWCPPGAKQGSHAFTPYDLASRHVPFKFYTSANSTEDALILKNAGGKSAKELGLTCQAVPRITSDQRKAAHCDNSLKVLDGIAKP